VIACDQPGFGLSDNRQPSVAYRTRFVLAFMDAPAPSEGHLVGHSQSGRIAVSLALEHGERRVSRVVGARHGKPAATLPIRKVGPPRRAEDGGRGTHSGGNLQLLKQSVFDKTLITQPRCRRATA